ncbi:glycosyltransferase family 2 protein [Camelimonas lactis]|uniref:GT2 family glycosyltransferase n=1 Tax=Camelimonas lactis TaxID=659006 RepID=A0A4R2GV60_9HYPH|nr:GT2 family glycosyltransferase [Camelimonas lactis]
MRQRMRITVVIATINRPELVAKTLGHLAEQQRLPDEILLSAPGPEHLGDLALARGPRGFAIRCLFGARGSCAQRNIALDAAEHTADIIVFFDDDFLPSPDYLANLEAAFASNPDYAVIRGHAVMDGAHGAGFTFGQGIALLPGVGARAASYPAVQDLAGGYGCNMSVRASAVCGLRFDERLPLYGWQEDIDFTSQFRPRGRIVALGNLTGVHLGVKGGRVSGLCFGYSQVVNPVYLIRKGTMSASFGLRLILRNLAANIARSLRPEPWIDRRGRLRGNLIAAAHVLRGRIEPEYVLKLQAGRR